MKKIIFNPTLEQGKKYWDASYHMKAYCSNCDDPDGGGYKNDVDVLIPKGMKKPTKKFKCLNCKIFAMTIC